MKKLTIFLTGLLVVASFSLAVSPIKEVRTHRYDSTIDCTYVGFEEPPNGQKVDTEGCGISVSPTVLQTWSSYAVLIACAGLTTIAAINLLKRIRISGKKRK